MLRRLIPQALYSTRMNNYSTKDTQVDRTEDVVDRIERIDPYGQWSASLSQKIAANVP